MSREDGAVKRSIRAEVLNKLAKEHEDDFDRLMSQAYADHGMTWVRPVTAEEKQAAKERAEFEAAKEQVDALIERFPGLKGRVAPVVAVDDAVEADAAQNVRVIDPAFSRATAAPV